MWQQIAQDMWQQIAQAVRFRPEDDDGDLSVGQILLVFDSLIRREEYVELRGFGCIQDLSVLEAGKARVARCLAIMTGQVVPELLINTLVDENTHLLACEQEVLRLFQRGDCGFTDHGGKAF